MNSRTPAGLGSLLALHFASACGGGWASVPADRGAGTAGAGTGGGGPAPSVAQPLPVPPGPLDLPAPSGSSANLRVLPWAGFASAVTYTIDDSQPSQVDHFSELKATGVRMTFYLNPSGNSYAGYDATWQAALAAGHELGNHTMNHCHVDLSGCNSHLGTLDEEIDHCSSYIETELGQADVWTFAFPFGDVGYEPYATSRFFLARGVSSGMVGPSDATDPLNLPIIAAKGGEAPDVFNADIDSALAQGRWLIFLFHSILPTTQNWYAGVDIGSITASIEHAKGLGTVWIDSTVNVGAYWLGQRTFGAVTPAEADGKTTWGWSLPALFPKGHVLRVAVDGGTLSQDGAPLTWDGHGYYEVALDAGTLTWTPP